MPYSLTHSSRRHARYNLQTDLRPDGIVISIAERLRLTYTRVMIFLFGSSQSSELLQSTLWQINNLLIYL